MSAEKVILVVAVALIVLRWLAESILNRLNQRHVATHRDRPPKELLSVMDAPTFSKAADYTLAKGRFGEAHETWSTLVLLAILLLGVLPWSYRVTQEWVTSPMASQIVWLLVVGFAFSFVDLPWDAWSQFKLEERFGFNTATWKTWCIDRIKGTALALILGVPLLWVILRLFEKAGTYGWLWAWLFVFLFQLLMAFLAPTVLMPLFNKFTPLPEGSLRDRLLELGRQTQFPAANIQVMDGSKRSRHANAFFTGFGKFRKIVLFDTLIQQLNETELAAVLAHEIGHYRLRHIPQRLVWAAVSSLGVFALLGWLSREPLFWRAFGFPSESTAAVPLLLFGLLAGTVSFWWSPLSHAWSRKHEFEADAYARKTMAGDPQPLIQALRKLSEKNLSNLTPHPLFSAVYYSHPTLWERETALVASSRATPR